MVSRYSQSRSHKLNPLQVCPPPSSVKQMRSFIGAYKAISNCIPNYSNHLGPLEDSVAGKELEEKLVWNDLVHIKAEGDKHTLRDFYLFVDTNTDEGEVVLQKFVGNQLRSKNILLS